MDSKFVLLPNKKAKSQSLSTNSKILLATNLILSLLAIAAACAAVVAVAYLFAKESGSSLREIEETAEETAEETLHSVVSEYPCT